MAISTAVSPDRVSNIVGYEVKKGFFNDSTPNLPQRIAVFGQANTDKQGGLSLEPQEVTSAQQAGEIYGFGSQIHIMMRIIRASTGDQAGGIPTVIYPQPQPSAGAARVLTITASGAATGDATINIAINGRTSIDAGTLQARILTGDTAEIIHGKIADAINAVLGSPVIAVGAAGQCTTTVKWQGASSQDLDIEITVETGTPGVTFAVAETSAGAGSSSADILVSLGKFGNAWNTIVVNPYGEGEDTVFETFNGTPGINQQGSRWGGEIFKPFVCLFGDTTAVNTGNELTSLNPNEATMVRCPAPNSKGWPFESAANYAVLAARQAQDEPHLDVSQLFLPDMPVPLDGDIGIFTDYNDRDFLVKGGCSTVDLVNGAYQIEDFVTGYRPTGEEPPQFRYVRSIQQDWNIRYGYFLLEAVNVVGKAIAENDQPVTVANVIKPKQWLSILYGYADDLATRDLIVDAAFMKESLQVGTSETNPDRLETFFRYKRSPIVRIASTTGEAGFAFGLN